jgi:hypothetical protein
MRTSNPTWRREFLNPIGGKGTPLLATLFNLYRVKVVTRWQNELRYCDGCSVGFRVPAKCEHVLIKVKLISLKYMSYILKTKYSV